ncbi:NUDIX hydrolase [Methylobacterium sp. J-030]|nr:NUDIX hydrolase [Methylobacterium sp. J-030]
MLRKAQAKPLKQVAALPFRISPEGRLEILLITSRDTGRWIIPKGWPMVGRKAHQAAEREAFEEAGLKGQIETNSLGKYRYDKRFDNGVEVPCEVRVYALRVDGQHERWPEQSQRALHWFAPAEAACLVQEDELAHLIKGFAGALMGEE